MLPTILVLTDFSAAADHALRYAEGLAGSLGAALVLVPVDAPLPLLTPEWAATEHLHSGEQVAGRGLATPPRHRLTAVADTGAGALVEAVMKAAGQQQTILLVVGRPDARGLPAELVAATALDLLRATPYPLLVVPHNTPASVPPRNVLLAADGAPFTIEPAAEPICRLLNSPAVRLTVVYVADGTTTLGSTTGALNAVCLAGLVSERATIIPHRVTNVDPAAGILATVPTLRSELVVLLARPHQMPEGVFHHSVTAEVIRCSPIPVLIVPAT